MVQITFSHPDTSSYHNLTTYLITVGPKYTNEFKVGTHVGKLVEYDTT